MLSRLAPIVLLAACAGPALAVDEDAKLAAFFKAYLDAFVEHNPYEATRLGDHRYDDRLNDLSPKARAENVRRQKDALARLPKEVEFGKLSAEGKVDYQILRDSLTKDVWLAENTKPFEEDPRVWNEYVSDSVYLILTQSTVRKARAVRAAAGRIEHIPAVVKAARESLSNPPKVFVETAIKQNRGAIAFYEKGHLRAGRRDAAVSVLADPAKAAVAGAEGVPEVPRKGAAAAGRRASGGMGKEKFAKKLELELDAGLRADEVLQTAEAEADARRARDVRHRPPALGKCFPNKALPPDDADGRRRDDPAVMAELGKDHGKRRERSSRTRRRPSEEIKTFISGEGHPAAARAGPLPDHRDAGVPARQLAGVPESGPAARPEGRRASTPSARRRRTGTTAACRATWQSTTAHAAASSPSTRRIPGHYVQLEYSNRHPSLIRRVL